MPKVNVEQERQLNEKRCQICGKWHPFITVCPYIKATRTRTEVIRDARNPNLRGRITTTEYEYFERAELLESAVGSLEEAEAIANDQSNAQP